MFLLGSMGYMSYQQMLIQKAFMAYPESVREPLSRAVFFHHLWKDPERAFKFYRQAIYAAQEAHLHSLSDGVLGIKGEIARFLQQYNNVPAAVQLYQQIREEALEWLEDNEATDEAIEMERLRIIKKLGAVDMQLVDWYRVPQVNRPINEQEELLTETVELILKEQQKLKDMKLDIGFSDEEIGAPLNGRYC
jgi:hypothetical protein